MAKLDPRLRQYPKLDVLMDAIGEAMGRHRAELEQRIDRVEQRVVPLEQKVGKMRVRVPARSRHY